VVTTASPPRPNLPQLLAVLCEDAFFAVAGSARLDLDALSILSRRRAPALALAAAGSPPAGMSAWEPWVLALCAALAPIAPPRFLPMAEVVSELSLEHGARGLRALFTSKPSEKEVERVRSVGSAAVRALGAVLGASGVFHAESRLLRAALIASLGLPDDEEQRLSAEAPFDAEQLDLHGDLDPKIARGIVRGAFFAALGDGVDARGEQAVITVARKLGLTTEEVSTARLDARRMVDGARGFGDASVEALRYLFADDPAASERLAGAAARLTLPAGSRGEALAAVTAGGPVTLGRKHDLDRKHREAVLGLCWVAAMHADPTVTRRAELALRHDDVAVDLGDASDGAGTRRAVDRHLEAELGALARPAAAGE
jgi:hypothetical protein